MNVRDKPGTVHRDFFFFFTFTFHMVWSVAKSPKYSLTLASDHLALLNEKT